MQTSLRGALLSMITAIVLVLAGSSCGWLKERQVSNPAQSSSPEGDTVLYYGGPIVTMEGAPGSVVEAVVTQGERIVFSGALPLARSTYADAVKFDLMGNTMMPGFIEQHLHPFLGALTLSVPVLAPEAWELPERRWPAIQSHNAYINALRQLDREMEDPDEPLFSWGYHHLFHGDLNRKLLDSVSSSRPIAIWQRSCHEFYMNSAMIDFLGIDQASIDAAGAEVSAQINLEQGRFYENGMLIYLLPKIMPHLGNPERFKAGLTQLVQLLHNNGITTFFEPGSYIYPPAIDTYQNILGAPATPLYSFLVPESKTPYHSVGPDLMYEKIRETTGIFPNTGKIQFLDKQIKLIADGAIIAQLMQMKDGYLDGHQGEWIQTPQELEEISKLFWDKGYQLHIHVNGDLGLEEVLAIIERRMAENPRRDHRTTIIHFATSSKTLIEKLAKLGCIISANPYYVTAFSDKYSAIGLGPERAQAMVRLAPAEALGVPISLHSDLPMAPSNPLYLAWTATTRHTLNGNTARSDLALSLHGALKAITIEAAYSYRMENDLGSIRPGKIANFTIIGKNPYKVGAEGLKNIPVRATVFEGKLFPVDQKGAAMGNRL